MPRTARQLSGTGIYHVMLRGIDRQQIFLDDEDHKTFIRLLKRFRDESGFDLFAYCLMGNHVHLLIRVHDEGPEKIFRRLGAAFVYRYNLKYQRTGHLFQDRYKSEPVEDDRYFLTVLRYILRNPVKAGLCSAPEDYDYSNCRELIRGAVRALPCALSGDELAKFIAKDNEDICMDVYDHARRGVTEATAERMIREEFGPEAPAVGKENRKDLDRAIQRLAEKGLSIRQISRLSGISKSVVERALK